MRYWEVSQASLRACDFPTAVLTCGLARAIQDQILKDFGSKSEFSDWFSREDVPRPPAIEKPNPRNIEHEQKIAALEERIKRLVTTRSDEVKSKD